MSEKETTSKMEASGSSPKTDTATIDIEKTAPEEVTRVNSTTSAKAGIDSTPDTITAEDVAAHQYLTGARLWLVQTGILL